jgi:nucleoside-diphosphate-sugar epimerase
MIVLVTGGCGHKGSVLVPKLIEAGHDVVVFDTCWFGVNLNTHKNLYDVLKGDIRDSPLPVGMDAIIHLAGIANDPCGELDARLTWEVNVLATMRLAEHAVRHGVKQFIFASSASVYGIKGGKPVVEDDDLAPVSDYNKTKQVGERVLLSYADKMAIQIVRPATVCGVSPRMRLDTMVNMLTMQALTKGEITAHCGEHGGNLMRPNIHIEDITDLYCWMLERPHLTGAYNAGFENLSALETAELIAKQVPAEIKITAVKDKRSYSVDSSKLLNAGFKPKHSVADAIEDIVVAHARGRIKDQDDAYNLKWMRQHGWVSETR